MLVAQEIITGAAPLGKSEYPNVYFEANLEFDRPDLVVVMDIRLIYKGQLLATGNDRLKPVNPARDADIHRIRREIHKQLAVLWDKHPMLKAKRLGRFMWSTDYRKKIALSLFGGHVELNELEEFLPEMREGYVLDLTEIEALGRRFNRCGHNFVPLVNDFFNTVCGLDILFLRREDPGHLITNLSGGDIDNRIKTLLDALQIPTGCSQVDGPPGSDETPFYTLLQDDGLVTDLKVTTDRLLMPVEKNENQNHVVLIIHAKVRTSQTWFDTEAIEKSDAHVLES